VGMPPSETLTISNGENQSPMVQPDPLVEAASAFLDEFMPILRERCPGEDEQPITLPGFARWVPELDLGGWRRYKAVRMTFTAEAVRSPRVR
jgi:hypothetical protein